VDLTKGGDNNADDDEGHVEEDLEVRRCETHGPGGQEHGNGSSSLSSIPL
jgi:hypothetical protein